MSTQLDIALATVERQTRAQIRAWEHAGYNTRPISREVDALMQATGNEDRVMDLVREESKS